MQAGVNSVIYYIPTQKINLANSKEIFTPDGRVNRSLSGSLFIFSMPAQLDSNSYSVSHEETDDGDIAIHTLRGFYPSFDQASVKAMNHMVRAAFLVGFSLPGREPLEFNLGSIESGARFSYSAETNHAPGEKAGIDFVWSWQTPEGITYKLPI